MSAYDVIVIGSGAGGGTLVHRLAPSGKRILLLERGGRLPREPQNWQCEEVLRVGDRLLERMGTKRFRREASEHVA
jgi:choline dehydrogenase-like flavoprotein